MSSTADDKDRDVDANDTGKPGVLGSGVGKKKVKGGATVLEGVKVRRTNEAKEGGSRVPSKPKQQMKSSKSPKGQDKKSAKKTKGKTRTKAKGKGKKRNGKASLSMLYDDALRTTAQNLDLASLGNFGSVNRLLYDISRDPQLKVDALVAAVIRARPEDGFEMYPELLRLVQGERRESVIVLKLQALERVLEIAQQESWLEFVDMIEGLFEASRDVRNLDSIELLLELERIPAQERARRVPEGENERYAISRAVLGNAMREAAGKNDIELLRIFLVHDGGRLTTPGMFSALRDAAECGATATCSALIAYLAEIVSPRLVNEALSVAIKDASGNGHVDLTQDMLTMLFLRVKTMRMHEASLPEEERDAESMARTVQLLRQTTEASLLQAIRNKQIEVVECVLRTPASASLDEETVKTLMETAIRNGMDDMVQLLLETERVDMKMLCRIFIDSARRGFAESVRVLAQTGAIPNPTLEMAKEEALRRGHEEVLEILNSLNLG